MGRQLTTIPKGTSVPERSEPSKEDSSPELRSADRPRVPRMPPGFFVARHISSARRSKPARRSPHPTSYQHSPLASRPEIFPDGPSATAANGTPIHSRERASRTPGFPPNHPLRSHPTRGPANPVAKKPGSSGDKAPRTLGHSPYYSCSHPPLPACLPTIGRLGSSREKIQPPSAKSCLSASSALLSRPKSNISSAWSLLTSIAADLEVDFKYEELYDRLLRTFSFRLRDVEESFESLSNEVQQRSLSADDSAARCHSLIASVEELTSHLQSIHSFTHVLKKLVPKQVGTSFYFTQIRTQWCLMQSFLCDLPAATSERDLRYLHAPKIARAHLHTMCDLLRLIVASWPKHPARARADRADKDAFVAFSRRASQALDKLTREQARTALSLTSPRLAVPLPSPTQMESADQLTRVMEARWNVGAELFRKEKMQRVVGAVVRFERLCVAFLDARLNRRSDFGDGVEELLEELEACAEDEGGTKR